MIEKYDSALPDGVLDDIVTRQFDYIDATKFHYKIVYPINYDSSSTYKVLLGLSGGNANDKIVNYCYYTLFDSTYFDIYITILPLGPFENPLSDMDSTGIDLLIADIMKNQKVTDHNWIVAGTSMGGFAAFNFARARPELFEGIITIPEGLRTEEIPEKWSSYKILLAFAELDEANWKTLNGNTKSKLEGNVKSIETFIIKGQDHIIAPDYDIDRVYNAYFTKEM